MTCCTSLAAAFLLTICAFASAARAADFKRGDVILKESFDTASTGAGKIAQLPGRGGVLEITNAADRPGASRTMPLPIDQLRNCFLYISADVKAQDVSSKPQSWNGIKLMAHITIGDRSDWLQPEIPVGTFDWQRFSTRIFIPADATRGELIIGLERVAGTVWFDNLTVTFARRPIQVAAAPADRPIFKGHDLPRLRGAMVSPKMREEDLAVLADQWGANLIRWQLIRSNVANSETDFAAYDKWLDALLTRTDSVLQWAKNHRVKVVLDLHSPPGGKSSHGGYMAAMGAIFTDPAAQQHFVAVWRKMAARYKGNTTIWGFDLVNEPVDDGTSESCQDWQELALTAGKAIREIDPDRILIVEPPRWGGPGGWEGFAPIPLDRVVYSFHMYVPSRFTHQRVFDKSQTPVSYPGTIDGATWNRQALIKAMQPAIDFANRYRVHMYVGEFSAIRWAPGAQNYLADVTSILEEQGWDWSYHAFREWTGWSLEYGTDEADEKPSPTPTARFNVIEALLKQNQKP